MAWATGAFQKAPGPSSSKYLASGFAPLATKSTSPNDFIIRQKLSPSPVETGKLESASPS